MHAFEPKKTHLLAQEADIGLDVVVLGAGFHAPHALDEQLLRHHLTGVAHEHLRQGKLLERQVDGLLPARQIVAFQVQREVACVELLEDHLALAAREGAQVRQQLGGAERLGHVVIGAAVQTGDLVGHGVARGEQQHRRAHVLAAQFSHYRETVHFGKHDIQDDHVVDVAFGISQPVGAVVHHVGAVAVLLQDVRQRAGKPHVVFHDEDLHGVPSVDSRTRTAGRRRAFFQSTVYGAA